MSEVSSFINPQQTVISIMGGVNIETLVASLDHKAVIRVMPNTPAQIGSGVSVWTATPQVTNSALEEAREIIGSFGEEIYVDDEKMIDMATALSGCGPGYVFLFIEALIDAGVNIGLSRDLSRTLVLQTVLGSAKLVRESGSHPAQLKDLVTSPAGATIAGVLALEQAGFRGTVINAVNLAYRKTKLLGD
jgi:pyrroline-5-carboxylate reductase